MKPPAFDYLRVETLDEALAVLADSDLDARILAGGQSLLPLLNMRLARPKTLVDVTRLPGLQAATWRTEDGNQLLEIGALVKQRQLERFTGGEPRTQIFHQALVHIGHPQTRNMGTIGGSLAHADPSAELPLLFTAVGGTAYVQSVRGERQIAAEDLFQSYFTTTLEPDEMLTKTVWRLPGTRTGAAFKEFRRRHGDFALVVAACVLDLDGERRVRQVRLGIGGVAEKPLLVQEARQVIGEAVTAERAESIAQTVAEQFNLADDVQASAAYRQQLAKVALTQVLTGAYQDALAKENTHAEDHS
jgi:CO/xanthine dehydrogenase FAD-binding subunit